MRIVEILSAEISLEVLDDKTIAVFHCGFHAGTLWLQEKPKGTWLYSVAQSQPVIGINRKMARMIYEIISDLDCGARVPQDNSNKKGS